MPRHRPPPPGRDTGAVTYHAIIIAVVILAVVGLVVDGGAMLHALQRANDIAREAARSAGQQVDFSDTTGPVSLDLPDAKTAGHAYLTTAGCQSGTIEIHGDVITATCVLVYEPVFLTIGTHTVTGQGQATPLRVN
jgi:hypothetical protein